MLTKTKDSYNIDAIAQTVGTTALQDVTPFGARPPDTHSATDMPPIVGKPFGVVENV